MSIHVWSQPMSAPWITSKWWWRHNFPWQVKLGDCRAVWSYWVTPRCMCVKAAASSDSLWEQNDVKWRICWENKAPPCLLASRTSRFLGTAAPNAWSSTTGLKYHVTVELPNEVKEFHFLFQLTAFSVYYYLLYFHWRGVSVNEQFEAARSMKPHGRWNKQKCVLLVNLPGQIRVKKKSL